MSEPWGLTGPQFLVLYGFALLLACDAVVVGYSRARRSNFRGDVRVELGTYERAYLNGAHRVADTAVAGSSVRAGGVAEVVDRIHDGDDGGGCGGGDP